MKFYISTFYCNNKCTSHFINILSIVATMLDSHFCVCVKPPQLKGFSFSVYRAWCILQCRLLPGIVLRIRHTVVPVCLKYGTRCSAGCCQALFYAFDTLWCQFASSTAHVAVPAAARHCSTHSTHCGADRKSTRLNSSHSAKSRMPSSA